MLSERVIVPTFSRPEFLWLCLDYLQACRDLNGLPIQVAVDAHLGKPFPPLIEIEQVALKFEHLNLSLRVLSSHPFAGNSYNVMTAYKEAFDAGVERIYLVEDDVMVAPTFFQWHRYVHEQEKPACSIGVVKEPQMDGFASLGVCVPREQVQKLLQHHKTEYFANQRDYCKHTFPPSRYECEQDGLWCRVLESQRVIWATVPQAQHVGWYGYHRPKSIRPTGTLEQRYQHIKQVITTPHLLKNHAKEFLDVKPLNLTCN